MAIKKGLEILQIDDEHNLTLGALAYAHAVLVVDFGEMRAEQGLLHVAAAIVNVHADDGCAPALGLHLLLLLLPARPGQRGVRAHVGADRRGRAPIPVDRGRAGPTGA